MIVCSWVMYISLHGLYVFEEHSFGRTCSGIVYTFAVAIIACTFCEVVFGSLGRGSLGRVCLNCLPFMVATVTVAGLTVQSRYIRYLDETDGLPDM